MKKLTRNQKKLLLILVIPLAIFAVVYYKTDGLISISAIAYLITFLMIYFENISKTMISASITYLATFFLVTLSLVIFVFIVLYYSSGEIGTSLLEVIFQR
jgi:hypothetical protein